MDVIQLQFPGGNPLFIFPGVEIPRYHTAFAPLDELALNIRHDPAAESVMNDSS